MHDIILWGQQVDPIGLSVLLGMLAAVYFAISFFSISFGLVILALSSIFSPEISVGTIGIRDVTLRIEDLLIPVLLVAWMAQTAARWEGRWFAESPLNKPILWLLGACLFSTLYGFLRGWVLFWSAFFYIGKIFEYFAIFFLVLNNVKTEHQIRVALFFALLTVALLGLYTIPQVSQTGNFAAQRISAPFEETPQPSTAGGYMAFFLIILSGLFLYADTLPKKWCLAALLCLIFIPFLFTFSRTSYLAFLGGMIILAVLARKRWLNYSIILLFLFSPLILPASVKERIAFTWEDSKNVNRTMGVDYSTQERIYSLIKLKGVFKVSPLIGMGVGASHYMDNQYARTIQELGILGMGLWLWIFIRLFKIGQWLHRSLDGGLLKGVALGYAAGVVCILIHAWGSVTFYVIRIMEPFWFVTGLVVSLYLIKTRETVRGANTG